MSSVRQISANQANAQKSTGPKTAEGIERASGNATTHGLSSAVKLGDCEQVVALRERIDLWIVQTGATTEFECWLSQVMAVESLRYEKCRTREAELEEKEAKRAELSWEIDRRSEVQTLAKKLADEPAETFAKLRRSMYGTLWLKGRWEELLAALEQPEGWNEIDRTLALDLLGTHLHPRKGRSPVDPFPKGQIAALVRREQSANSNLISNSNGERPAHASQRPIDPSSADALKTLPTLREEDPTLYRIGFVEAMIEYLTFEAARLEALDAIDRRASLKKVSSEVSQELKLLRRYEAAAFRRFQWALKCHADLTRPEEEDEAEAESGASDDFRAFFENSEADAIDPAETADMLRQLREDAQARIKAQEEPASKPLPETKIETKPTEAKSAAKVVVKPTASNSIPTTVPASPSNVSLARTPFAGIRDALLGVGSLNRRQRRALSQSALQS